MNLSIENILTLGAACIAIVSNWVYVRFKVDALDKRDEILERTSDEEHHNIWNEMGKVRTWMTVHEKDSYEMRAKFHEELSKIRELTALKDGKIDEIIRRLETLDKKIDKLESNTK